MQPSRANRLTPFDTFNALICNDCWYQSSHYLRLDIERMPMETEFFRSIKMLKISLKFENDMSVRLGKG